MSYVDYIKIFVGLLAIVNPIGAVPLFISITSDETNAERRVTARTVAIGTSIILLTALFAGEELLFFFGITVDSFRVGGGILLLLMAIAMLHGKTSQVKQTSEELDESIAKENVAIVPLAMPLLAGPGAISAVILAAHRGTGLAHYALLSTAIIVLGGLVWVALRLAPLMARRLGATGINVFTRIMGLILAAISVEFIANGLKGLFPVLGGPA